MLNNEKKPPAEESKEEQDITSSSHDFLSEAADESKEEERGPEPIDTLEVPPLTANLRAASQQAQGAKLPRGKSISASDDAENTRTVFGVEEIHDSDDDVPRPGVASGIAAMEPRSLQNYIQSKMSSNMTSSITANDHKADEKEPPNPISLEARRTDDEEPPSPFSLEERKSSDASRKSRSKLAPTSGVIGPLEVPLTGEDSEADTISVRNSNSSNRNSNNDLFSPSIANTDDAIFGTDMPHAVPVNLDDDEETNQIHRGRNQQQVYYGAYEVNPNEPPPALDNRWKCKVILSVAALSVAVIIAAVVGSVLTSNNKTESKDRIGVGVSAADVSRTEAPTLPPAPLDCTIKDMGPVWPDGYCNWCDIVLGRDGNTIVITTSDAYAAEDEMIKGFEVVVGPFRMESHIPDHAMLEIAFSDTHFFAADALDWNGGVVHVSPKGPSGDILDGTVDVKPAHGDTDYPSEFGHAIAVDNDILVVGAPKDDGLAGSAFIFRQNANNASDWKEEVKFVPPDFGVPNFGNSVLVKGNFVVVAANQYGDDTHGAVFFYEYDPLSKSWITLTNQTLADEDCDGNFGASLAFSGDDGLLVGCPMKDDATGAVYSYQRYDNDDGSWGYEHIQTITAKGGDKLEQFGGNSHHLTMSSNGDFMAIGTYNDVEFGANETVYLFSKFDNSWLQVGRIDAPADTSYFGDAAVISGDRVLISSWENIFSYEMTCVEDQDRTDQKQAPGVF